MPPWAQAPFQISPHNPSTLYMGGQRVWKTVDRGEHWMAISQDLSTHFRGEGRYVLHKPIEQSQFDRTLAAIEGRLQTMEAHPPEVESY